MNTIFMNSKNSKTSDPHRQLLNLINKTDLRRKDKYTALSNLSILYTSKNMKKDKSSQFWRIFAKFGKLNSRKKSTGSQFAKLNPRAKKIFFFFFRFSELVKLTFLH